jgi:hypothetical protein
MLASEVQGSILVEGAGTNSRHTLYGLDDQGSNIHRGKKFASFSKRPDGL